MPRLDMDDVRERARRSKDASFAMQGVPLGVRNGALQAIADQLMADAPDIVEANRRDLAEAKRQNLSGALVKRLNYDHAKVQESVRSIESLMGQEDPVGKVLGRTELDAGLVLEKVTCPIGVIAVIFESRPDALVQISTLCLKSGNAVLLKGGSEAKETNIALTKTITSALANVDGRFHDAVQLLSTREEVRLLLAQDDLVDLIIPRGSNELVRSIQASTRIPVLGHAAGVCHTYVDRAADLSMALKVCYDAKVQYPAVCNAMETLLVDVMVAGEFLPLIANRYLEAGVEIRGDDETLKIIGGGHATEDDWSTEYNDLIISMKVVRTLDEAVEHINHYGSHHTDAIITDDEGRARSFMEKVDSASVMWNCSTRFADGYRYGLGAEVGISTNKTHARGPVGLEGLVIYKWRLSGHGHVVADYVGPDAKPFTHRKLT
jgi:glutamate-5-semialdehyde dehydrogenase